MNRTVIAGYVRTPFAFARKGPFHATRPDDLAAVALAELVRRSGIDPHLIEDVLMGCAYPEGAQGDNVARIASLLAGLPVQIGAATVNRFCGSSMYAIHMAAGQIAIGAGEAFIAAGVEHDDGAARRLVGISESAFRVERTSRCRRSDPGVHANGRHCRKRGGTLGYFA